MDNFKWVQNFIFPLENIYIQFINKFLKFKEMQYLIHHVKVDMWPALCKFPILFSAVKFNLVHNFFQFINRFKIVSFESCT